MKILFYTDSPAVVSGMGRVALNLGMFFSRLPGVDFASIGWHHAPFTSKWNGWKVYPVEKTGVGEDGPEVENAIRDFEPDVVITLGDLWYFKTLPALSEIYPFKWYAYFNVDSDPVKLDCLPNLIAAHGLATTTEYGRDAIHALDPSLDIDVVYHGYDPTQFKWRKHDMSRRMIPDQQGNPAVDLSGKFVILMDAQNTYRKNYPAALNAYSKFKADKMDTHLVLVTKPSKTRMGEGAGDYDGYDLEYAAKNIHNLLPNCITIVQNDITRGDWYSDTALNTLYNFSQVYMSVARGEGFGLSFLQACATKTIPLVTDYASYPELVERGGGMVIDVAAYDYNFKYLRVALIDGDDCAAKLQILYDDWHSGGSLARQIHGEGMAFAAENTWEHSFKTLAASIFKMMAKPHRKPFYPNIPMPLMTDLRSHAAKTVRARKTTASRVGMVIMGGLGDNVQALPVVKGIAARHPDSNLFLVCEGNSAIFKSPAGKNIYHPNLNVVEMPQAPFSVILKSICTAFDYFYDVRYVSRVYTRDGDAPLPDESIAFFNQNSQFYHQWPWTNNVIHHLDKHVVDIRLLSCGLQDYASIDDMVLEVSPLDLPGRKIVSVHNAAGGIGKLKILPMDELAKVVRWLDSCGYWVVQTGTVHDPPIPGAIDMRGRTDYWQTAYILREAEIHIGPEGALYHMAKAVGGRALTWLSVTPPEVFTYPGSIVLPSRSSSDFKCQPCWWAGQDYFHNRCMLGHDHCLNLPTGEEIIEALEEQGYNGIR